MSDRRKNNPGRKGFDSVKLLEQLRAATYNTGRVPRARELRGLDLANADTYVRHFGSYREAVRLAGFEPDARGGRR